MFIAWGTIRQNRPKEEIQQAQSMSRVHTYNIPGEPTKSGGRNCTKVLNRVQYRPPTHRRTRASMLCQRWSRGNPATEAGLCSGRTLFLSHSQSKNKDTNDTFKSYKLHRHTLPSTSLYHRRRAQLQINTCFWYNCIRT